MIGQICLDELLLESAKEVFETTAFMNLTETAEPDRNDVEGWALLGSITFKGSLEGYLAINCKVSCAQAIAANMLRVTTEQLTEEDTCDAVSEIANMIMSGVKKRLLGSLGNIEISIPSIISRREIKNHLSNSAEKISVKVNIEDKYVAELSLLCEENFK
ncbi:MAG: chemotaxis protein CheX [Phycisphaerae bacterium]|jgi:CheY-specific phosphatase CheX